MCTGRPFRTIPGVLGQSRCASVMPRRDEPRDTLFVWHYTMTERFLSNWPFVPCLRRCITGEEQEEQGRMGAYTDRISS